MVFRDVLPSRKTIIRYQKRHDHVGTNDEYVKFDGADEVFLPEYLPVYIGGAFDSLYSAHFHTRAWVETCHILTNKDETLGSTLTAALCRRKPCPEHLQGDNRL